jgi:SPP1 family predicted phage head-tail adaptor
MTIGELNCRISILEQDESKDSFGGVVGDWIVVGRVWANVNEAKNTEKIADGRMVFTVRFYAGLSAKHRIEYNKKFYEVTGFRDPDGTRRWTEISAKEIESGENIQRETEKT